MIRGRGLRMLPAAVFLAAMCGGAPAEAVDPPSLTEPSWRAVADGLEFVRVEARRYLRTGSPGVAVVRIDPRRARIEPHHEREYPREARATIDGWQDRLGAPVLLNAGLYGEDRRHLGILRRDGRDIGGVPHATWKGILVSGPPTPDLPAAAVLDLSQPRDEALAGRYAQAVQSMMLFGRGGELRVRKSERAAPRSVVAEDARGRIYLFVTEGSFTLWETGLLLVESGWELMLAMALDGGNEANLAVETGAVRYRSHHGEDPEGDPDFFRSSATLPCVLAVRPQSP